MVDENTSVTEENKLSAEEVPTTDVVEEQQQEPAVDDSSEGDEGLTEEQINWRKFREERAKERAQKEEELKQATERQKQQEEQIRAYREALEQVMDKPDTGSLSQKEQDKIIADLMDEDIPTGADIKGFINQVVPKIVDNVLQTRDQQLEEERRRREAQEMPVRLQREHKDFSNIVTQENLDYLEYHYPEVAETLGSLPNSYDKWSKVYKTVKRLVPDGERKDVARMERNSQKPQSMASTSAASTSEVAPGRRLTDAQKAENYRLMRERARGA